MTKDNHMLGKFNLDGIPPAPRGVPQIEITYDVDANGILNVAAVEKSTGKSNKITITNDKGRLSTEDIERMVAEAEKFKEQDEENKGRIEGKNNMENYLYQTKNSISENSQLPKESVSSMTEILDEGLKWLESNQNETKQVYEDKLKEITEKFKSLLPEEHNVPGAENIDPSSFDPSQFTAKKENVPERETKAPTSTPKIEEVD